MSGAGKFEMGGGVSSDCCLLDMFLHLDLWILLSTFLFSGGFPFSLSTNSFDCICMCVRGRGPDILIFLFVFGVKGLWAQVLSTCWGFWGGLNRRRLGDG